MPAKFHSVKLPWYLYSTFLGGYLLYGALFAAVGSAVDSQQEAQQFQFPVTIPLLDRLHGVVPVYSARSARSYQFLAICYSFHIACSHGGSHWVWCTCLGAGSFYGFTDRWIFVNYLDSRSHIPRWYTNDGHQGKLQGIGQVVYAKRIG
jgi:hypothetical protein